MSDRLPTGERYTTLFVLESRQSSSTRNSYWKIKDVFNTASDAVSAWLRAYAVENQDGGWKRQFQIRKYRPDDVVRGPKNNCSDDSLQGGLQC